MNRHARKAAYFLALSLIFTGCNSPAPEAEAVEQEVTVETPANDEIETSEKIETSTSEGTPVTETEETSKEELEQTSEVEKIEVEEPAEEKNKSVETEMTVKEEPTVEKSVVETPTTEETEAEKSSDEEVISETPVTEEPSVEESSDEEVVSETPVAEEPTIEEPVVEEPKALTGTFSATGNSYDDYGWKPSLSLTFENDTITNVNYDEINADGAKKSQDTGYLSYFNQQTGVKLDEVYKTLSKNLLAVQTPESVDSVSGATIASDNFIKLAKKIIADNQ